MSPRLLVALPFLVAATGLVLASRRTEALVRARVTAPAERVTIDLRPAT